MDEDIHDHMEVVEETVIGDITISPTDDGEVSRQLMSEISMSQSFTEQTTTLRPNGKGPPSSVRVALSSVGQG